MGPAHSQRPARSGISLMGAIATALIGALVCSDGARLLDPSARQESPAGQRPTIVVADVAERTGDAELGSISGLLTVSLEQSRRFAVTAHGGAARLLERQARSVRDGVDREAWRHVASALGARALLLPEVRRLEGSYVVSVDGVSPTTGAAIFSLQQDAPGLSSIPSTVDLLADRARSALGEPETSIHTDRASLGRVLSSDLEACAHHFDGEALLWQGDVAGAVAELEAAVALDPAFLPPQLDLVLLSGWTALAPAREERVARSLSVDLDRLPRKERLLARAWLARREDRDEDARRAFAEAASGFPLDWWVLLVAGEDRHRQGDLVGAVALLTRAFELPGHPWPLEHAVPDLVELGRSGEALALARRAAGESPAYQGLLQRTLRVLGQDDGELDRTRVLAGSGEPEAVLDYADELSVRGHLFAAEQAYLHYAAPRFSPEVRHRAWHGRMTVAARRGRMHAAVEFALRADEVPGLSRATRLHTRLSAVYMALGLPAEIPRVQAQLAWLESRGPPSLDLALVAQEAGVPEVVRRFESRLSPREATVLAALRGSSSPTARIPFRADDDAGRYAAMLLAERAARDGDVAFASDRLTRFWERPSAWREWAIPRARVVGAGALLRRGERESARAVLAPLARALDHPDADLPWMPEYRRLLVALASVEERSAGVSR